MVHVTLTISTIIVNGNALNASNERQRFSFKRHSRRGTDMLLSGDGQVGLAHLPAVFKG